VPPDPLVEDPPSVSTVCVASWKLLQSLRKPDDLICHSGLSSFPVLKASYPVASRHSHNGRLLCSSLYGQNLQLVLTILGGCASVAEPMVRTTPPKVDKVGTSSAEAPTAQALTARSGNKVPDDALVDNDPGLLNFTVAVS
jgi:hypothetical protein